MASSNGKSFTSIVYWCLAVGGALVVFFAVKTVYTWGNGPVSPTEAPVVESQDDVVSLEKDFNALSKTSVDGDLNDLENLAK